MEVELKESVETNHLADSDEAPLLAAESDSADAHVAANGTQRYLDNGFHERGSNDSELKEASTNESATDLQEVDAPLLSKETLEQSSDSTSSQRKASHDGLKSKGTLVKSSDSLQQMEAKYAAYVRKDSYGTLGLGPVSLLEKIMLCLAFIILVPLRLILLVLILLTYYIICRFCTLFRAAPSHNEVEAQESYGHILGLRRTIIVQSGRFLTRSMLFVLGFYWIKESYRNHDVMRRLQLGLEDLDSDQVDEGGSSTPQNPGAIVSNHVSYLDILYHMSASFPSFVAKRSVAKLPFVGLISKCLGCIYVQRESKTSDFKGVSGIVTERLQAASSEQAPLMLLFPEGTTTNGDYLLPFKTGAFLSPTPVSPVILKYPYRRFSPAWDTIAGTRHLFLLLCQVTNFLEVVRLPVYHPSAEEKLDPKLYASNVRTLMAAEGGLTMANIGLPEKRVYHAALQELFSPGVETQENE